jgi:ficolin
MSYHNGMKFSTKDVDNDAHSSQCSQDYKGAWWYDSCYHSNLNGGYSSARVARAWNAFTGNVKTSEMKVRPVG